MKKKALKKNKLTRTKRFKEKWEKKNFYYAIKWKWEKIKGKLKMEEKRKFLNLDEKNKINLIKNTKNATFIFFLCFQ